MDANINRACALDIVDCTAEFIIRETEPGNERECLLADLCWLRISILKGTV